VASAPGYAAQSGTVSESKKLVTGQASQADTVAVRVKTLMSDLSMGDLPVERFDMAFGAYGSLPLVIVGFDSCKLVIDATNGLVLAPVPHQGTFNAQALLASHGITGDYGIRLYNSKGCVASYAPSVPPQRRDRPPSPMYPPQPVIPPATIPGNPRPWVPEDRTTPLGPKCVFSRWFTYINPGPPPTTFRMYQYCRVDGYCDNRTNPGGMMLDCWFVY
jgi:hypothetical protein